MITAAPDELRSNAGGRYEFAPSSERRPSRRRYATRAAIRSPLCAIERHPLAATVLHDVDMGGLVRLGGVQCVGDRAQRHTQAIGLNRAQWAPVLGIRARAKMSHERAENRENIVNGYFTT